MRITYPNEKEKEEIHLAGRLRWEIAWGGQGMESRPRGLDRVVQHEIGE